MLFLLLTYQGIPSDLPPSTLAIVSADVTLVLYSNGMNPYDGVYPCLSACKINSSELNDYGQCRQQILEWYPDRKLPTAEVLEQKINALLQERSQKNIEFQTANQKSKDLANAQRTIEEFLRQERNDHEQNRRRKKNGDLE